MIWSFEIILIDICPEARFIKHEGIKKGEIFLGLRDKFSALVLIPSSPPIPEPIKTPVL